MLNTIGSIAPMIGLLGTVSGMIGAFNVLAEAGMGGDSSQQMAGNIGSALWTTAAGLVVAIPTLIAYFLFKTKFGNITAAVNQTAGDMVFTLVRAARGDLMLMAKWKKVSIMRKRKVSSLPKHSPAV